MAGTFNLGRGTVTVGTADMGNCSSFSFSASAAILEHPTYTSGLKVVEQIIIQWSFNGSFTTDTLTSDVLNAGLGAIGTLASNATQDVAFVGAEGIVGNPVVHCTLPSCIVELGGANLINGDDWAKITVNFKGKCTSTDLITIGI